MRRCLLKSKQTIIIAASVKTPTNFLVLCCIQPSDGNQFSKGTRGLGSTKAHGNVCPQRNEHILTRQMHEHSTKSATLTDSDLPMPSATRPEKVLMISDASTLSTGTEEHRDRSSAKGSFLNKDAASAISVCVLRRTIRSRTHVRSLTSDPSQLISLTVRGNIQCRHAQNNPMAQWIQW